MSLKHRIKPIFVSCISARGATVGFWFAATALVAALGLESYLGMGLRSPFDNGFLSTFSGGLWATVMVPFYFAAYFAGAANADRFGKDASFGDALKASIRITVLATIGGFVVIFCFLSVVRLLEAIHYGHGSYWSSLLSLPILFLVVGVVGSIWTIPVGCLSGALLFAVTRGSRVFGIVAGGVAFLSMAYCLLFGVYSVSRRGILPSDTPRISTLRPPGSPCGPNDSASIKRADQHPLGPTGGWSSVKFFDDKRTKDLNESAITFFEHAYTGYLRFPESGTLKIRAYDDIYGTVYCGWSENTIHIDRSEHASFFQLGRCTVGDGGVLTVHEICWFPEGQSEGRVILSSEHGNRVGESLEPADLYVEGMVSKGKVVFYQSSLPRSLALSFAKRGEIAKAQSIVTQAIESFSAQRPAVEMATGRSISPQEQNSDDWVLLLSLEIGLDIISGDFASAPAHFERLESFFKNPPKFCSVCEYTRTMLPLYRYLLEFERMQEAGAPRPELPQVEAKNVYGHNPKEIVELLRQTSSIPATKSQHAEYEFWLGVRCLINSDSKCATESFGKFLSSERPSYAPLESVFAVKHLRAAIPGK